MKQKMFWTGLVICLTLVFSCFSFADSWRGVERMSSGAYWPLGSGVGSSGKGGWLYGAPGHPDYVDDEHYHLAVDYVASEGSYVFAVANGEIIGISDSEDSGWGTDNACAVVKHRTADGDSFVAFYGHIRLFSGYGVGSMVWGGLPFARLGPYSASVPHVHFAIRPNTESVGTHFGTASIGSWPNLYGFVEPIAFLQGESFNWQGDDSDWSWCVLEGSDACHDNLLTLDKDPAVLSWLLSNSEIASSEKNNILACIAGGYTSDEQDNSNSDDGDSGTYEPDSDPDLHISWTKVRYYKQGDFKPEINASLTYGQGISIEIEGAVRNSGNVDLEDVDIDYRVDASKARFDRDDTRLDDDLTDIDEDERVKKHSGKVTITVAQDGRSVRVQGPKAGESFPTINNFVTIYFFLDVECDGDKDLSSASDRSEYAKVEITIEDPPITANFNATPVAGTPPLTVSFTDTSTGPVNNRNWSFGDGTSSSATSPTHIFNEPGTYTTTLTVVNFNHVSYKQLTIVVEEPASPYTFAYATTAEAIQDEGDYFYKPINPKEDFFVGETIAYLAQLDNINIPFQFKLEIRHRDGWGWDEEWNWDDPGTGWEYTFFDTHIENVEEGFYTLTLFVRTGTSDWIERDQQLVNVWWRGDFNKDRKVDMFDYNIFLGDYGKTGCGLTSDLDGNCKVDFFDYNIFLGDYGKGA